VIKHRILGLVAALLAICVLSIPAEARGPGIHIPSGGGHGGGGQGGGGGHGGGGQGGGGGHGGGGHGGGGWGGGGWDGGGWDGDTSGYYQPGAYYGDNNQGYYQPQPTGAYYQPQPTGAYYQPQPTGAYYQPQQQVTGPIAGQAYQVPAEYANTAPGYVITYGGANYLVGDGGTMTPYSGPVSQPATSTTDTTTTAAATGPIAGQRYQVPAANAGAAPGSLLAYHGYNYLVGSDATMVLYIDSSANKAATEAFVPVPRQKYQIPAEFAEEAKPGDVLTYNGYDYRINADKTMTVRGTPGK